MTSITVSLISRPKTATEKKLDDDTAKHLKLVAPALEGTQQHKKLLLPKIKIGSSKERK